MNDRENQELGDLILQITKGNTEAIGEIFKRVGSAMEAVASIYLKNAADVEDVVQDSLVTIVTKASKFRENRNAKAWINTIVHNMAKNKLRYYGRHKASSLEDAHSLSTRYDEDTLIVREIVQTLSKAEKNLVIYRYWYRCSIAEIAAILHRPKSTIQYRLEQLEEKIKKFYENE